MSCDTEPTDVDGPHHQGDVLPLLRKQWDMVIAFPPCTDLANVNAHHMATKRADGRTAAAAAFFMECWAANAPKVCVENPLGEMTKLFRRPDVYIQPWEYGHPWSKRTGLWLRGLPILMPTELVHRKEVKSLMLHIRGPEQRSQTFTGIATAMANQWG